MLLYDTFHLSPIILSTISLAFGLLSFGLYATWWVATKRISSETYVVDAKGSDIIADLPLLREKSIAEEAVDAIPGTPADQAE